MESSEGQQNKSDQQTEDTKQPDVSDKEKNNDSEVVEEPSNSDTVDTPSESEDPGEDEKEPLTKKDIKSLMNADPFDVDAFMECAYENKDFHPTYAVIKTEKKEQFLKDRSEEELYQICQIFKYTLLNQYLKFTGMEVTTTDMSDLCIYLADYQMVLERWIQVSAEDGEHLTDEQKLQLDSKVLAVILKTEELDGISDLATYDEYLKQKDTKLDVSGLLDMFGKLDLTSEDTMMDSMAELIKYSYKIFGVSAGEVVTTKPGSSKRKARSSVSTYASNGQEVSIADGLYYITISNQALQVDKNGKESKTNVSLWSTTGSGYDRSEQRWIIEKQSNGWYNILGNASYYIPDDAGKDDYVPRKCLDVENGSTAAGANVDIFTNNGTDAQYWKFYYYNGKYIIKNKLGTVLDVKDGNIANGTNVQAFTQNNTTSQQWTLTKITNDTVYLNRSLSKSGTGYTPSSPVRNMSEAYDLLKYCGGTIYFVDTWTVGSNVVLTDTSYKNSAGYPKDVQLLSGCTVTFKRYSGFTANKNMIYAKSGSFTMKNLTLDGNKDNVKKVNAILYNEMPVTLENCTFQNSDSYNDASFIVANGNITATGCTFTNGHSSRPSGGGYTTGGVWMHNNTLGTFTDCTFSNMTENTACCIFFAKGIFKNCKFLNNGKDGNVGYAAALQANAGDLQVDGCTFDGNEVTRGGGAINSNNDQSTSHDDNRGHISIKNSIFQNNKAGESNAAIMLTKSCQTDNVIDNCQFYNNNSGYGGGAVGASVNDNLTISNCTFDGNSSGTNGGAVSLQTVKGTVSGNTFTNNTANSAGALDIQGTSSNISITGNTYKNNSSVYEGGAIRIQDQVKSANISNEYFYKNSSVSGGAITILTQNVTVMNSRFYNNSVSPNSSDMYGYGGAVYLRNKANVTLSGNTYNSNTARWGGAIDIQSDSTATLTDEVMTGNRTTAGGGAIHNNGTSTKIINGTYTDNYSSTSGGVILNSGNITISYSSSGSTSGLFQNNSSGNDGGAISSYVQDNATPTITLNGITFKGNSSKVGGAINVQKNTVLNLSNTTISSNTATTEGGGIANAGIVSMDSGSMSGNTAPEGAAICQNGTLNLSKTATINSNNDVYLHSSKFITVPAALTSSFGAKITPSDYTLGRTVVRNTYGAKGSALEPKFSLTPNGSYFLYGGDLIASCNNADVVISRKYTITYNANGGTGGPGSQDKLWGVGATISSVKPTRTGYLFAGWNTNANGTGTTYYGGDTYSTESDLTLYAQWTPITYYVKFNANGGSGTMSNESFTYDVAKNLTANSFTRSGYKFIGWNTNANGTGTSYSDRQSVKNLSSTNGAVINLYAQWEQQSYYVRFDANGGSGSMTSQEFQIDVYQYLKENTFTKTGYTFAGWNTRSDGYGTSYSNQQYVKNLTTAGNTITLYAQWTANTYTVKYNGNGNTGGSTASSTHTYDVAKNLTANGFTKTGYTFAGWNTRADGYGTSYADRESVKNLTSTPGGTVTLYAQWTANTYTVVYRGNGNTGGSTASSTHTYDVAKNLTANGFTKTGYTFAGWNTRADGYGTSYADRESVKNLTSTAGGTVYLYAQWTPITYTVVYRGNGNTGGSTASSSHTYDVYKSLTANGFTKTGYSFAGWNTRADGYGTSYADCESVKNLTSTAGGTVYLYAQWTANTYTVTYNANGGTGSMSADNVTYDSNYVTKQSSFSKTGYTFSGWNERADGTGTDWTSRIGVGFQWNYTRNVTLYAQWTPNTYKISYNGNGNTGGSTASSTHIYDVAKNLTANGFTKTGYTFTGWNTRADGYGTGYADRESVKNLTSVNGATVTLYAQWSANTYTVIYDGNGNTSGSTASSSHTYDVAKNLTANGFRKTGYTFAGWNTKADGSGTGYSDKQSVKNLTSTVNGTVRLYAQWTANKYTIVFNSNGGTGTMASQEMAYDKAANLTANTFKRTGYRFDGWNTKADGTGTNYADKALVKNLTSEAGGTVTLYAKWYSEAPVLDAKDVTYYEGQEVTKAMLLRNVTKATDAEDGDVTAKVKIVKIAYAAGKLVDGKSQAAYEINWTDMPDDTKLDTWFMQLPKEKAPVTHKITYQVTDLSGKTTTKTSSIIIKYNEFPVITADDRYFTLDDAKAGKITENALLKDAITGGKLKAEDVEEGNLNSKLTILDYRDTDFKNVNGNATITVIYKVTDSMGPNGVGKETVREAKVHIIDTESPYWRDDDESRSNSIRFISKKYYDKNKGKNFNNMTSEEIDSSSANGGLNVMSKWYQNTSYKNLITGTFGKATGTDYKISAEKVKQLKQQIESNGIGNSKSSTALTTIYNSLK